MGGCIGGGMGAVVGGLRLSDCSPSKMGSSQKGNIFS